MKYTVEVDLWNLSGTILWWKNEEGRNIVLTENGKLIVFADPDVAKENYPISVNSGIALREVAIKNIIQSEKISVPQASEFQILLI